MDWPHLYIGEEAIATGVCANITSQDYAVSIHRGHGHLIAQGADLKKIMAEVLGRKDGYCNGKGGSMHIMDADKGILGATGLSVPVFRLQPAQPILSNSEGLIRSRKKFLHNLTNIPELEW